MSMSGTNPMAKEFTPVQPNADHPPNGGLGELFLSDGAPYQGHVTYSRSEPRERAGGYG